MADLDVNVDLGQSAPFDVFDTEARASLVTAVAHLAVCVTALQGTLAVGGTVAVSNHPTPQTDALTDTQLRVTPVPISGTVSTGLTQPIVDGGTVVSQDIYTDGETLADQSGTAEVLTFTFAAPVQLVVIQPAAEGARADPFGGTPGAAAGIPLLDGAPNFVTVATTTVDVYVATGSISVWGFRY